LKKKTFFGKFGVEAPNQNRGRSTWSVTQTEFVIDIGSLYDSFSSIQDARKRRGIRYSLPTLLLLVVLAKLCGQDKPYGIADWVKQRQEMLVEVLQLGYARMPHHNTYERILELCESEINRSVSEFLAKLPEVAQTPSHYHRRQNCARHNHSGGPVWVAFAGRLCAWCGRCFEAIASRKRQGKRDCCGSKSAGKSKFGRKSSSWRRDADPKGVITQIGDYAWIVKNNQPKTREAIEQLFAPQKAVRGQGCPPMDFSTAKTTDKAHGRLEERSITVSSLLNDYIDWPAIQQVFKIERRFTYEASGKVHHEIQYGITSLTQNRHPPREIT